jgi:hypothetical protein
MDECALVLDRGHPQGSRVHKHRLNLENLEALVWELFLVRLVLNRNLLVEECPSPRSIGV